MIAVLETTERRANKWPLAGLKIIYQLCIYKLAIYQSLSLPLSLSIYIYIYICNVCVCVRTRVCVCVCMDFALNNLQGLICHKTCPIQINPAQRTHQAVRVNLNILFIFILRNSIIKIPLNCVGKPNESDSIRNILVSMNQSYTLFGLFNRESLQS